jgi:hypothetical protein
MPPTTNKIPVAVAAAVNDVLKGSHASLDRIFRLAGAAGDPPALSHASKWKTWLLQTNAEPNVDAYVVLGRVLEEFMEVDPSASWPRVPEEHEREIAQRETERDRIREILARNGLRYHQGGKILSANTSGSTRALDSILRDRDLAALDVEFQRALDSIEKDPPAAVTSACAIVEAMCKLYIEDEGLEPPSEQTAKPLWRVVQKHLGLDPAQISDDDLKRILTGLASIVDGIGAFRTHVGSAHGRGRTAYRPAARHARLAVHSAHSLVVFVLETWDARRGALRSTSR